jgi:hypothetical protein
MQRNQRGGARGNSSDTEPGQSRPRDITSTIGPGRSTGSRDLGASPSHTLDACSGVIDAPTLAYRCGGSTGISPVSRLTRRAKLRSGTRYRMRVDGRLRKARRPHEVDCKCPHCPAQPGCAVAPHQAPRIRARANSKRPQALKHPFPGLWQRLLPAALYEPARHGNRP